MMTDPTTGPTVEDTAEAIMDSFSERFGDDLIDIRLDVYRDGLKKRPAPTLWIRVNKARFHEAMEHLTTFGQVHNTVASGSDLGDEIEILYHMSVYFEEKYGEVTVTIGLRVPKEDPHYPTITDIIPGAVPTEREKQEFLGVVVDGLPDPRKLWLLESDLPDDMYPWRKDEFGPEKFIRRVHEFDKPPEPGPAPEIIPEEPEPIMEESMAGEPTPDDPTAEIAEIEEVEIDESEVIVEEDPFAEEEVVVEEEPGIVVEKAGGDVEVPGEDDEVRSKDDVKPRPKYRDEPEPKEGS